MALPRAPAELLTREPTPVWRHRHGSALDPDWDCAGGAEGGNSGGSVAAALSRGSQWATW